jgi:hypothetical protein
MSPGLLFPGCHSWLPPHRADQSLAYTGLPSRAFQFWLFGAGFEPRLRTQGPRLRLMTVRGKKPCYQFRVI